MSCVCQAERSGVGAVGFRLSEAKSGCPRVFPTQSQPESPTGIRTIFICVRGDVIHITQNHWHSTGESCLSPSFFPLIKGVRAQRSKPMPTTHFHIVPALPVSSFCLPSSSAEQNSPCVGRGEGKGHSFCIAALFKILPSLLFSPLSKFIQVKSAVQS